MKTCSQWNNIFRMAIFRMAGGRIQEIWVNMDRLGEAVQLGWIASLTG